MSLASNTAEVPIFSQSSFLVDELLAVCVLKAARPHPRQKKNEGKRGTSAESGAKTNKATSALVPEGFGDCFQDETAAHQQRGCAAVIQQQVCAGYVAKIRMSTGRKNGLM